MRSPHLYSKSRLYVSYVSSNFIHQTTQPNFAILENPIQIHDLLLSELGPPVLFRPRHVLKVPIYLLQEDPVMWLLSSFDVVQLEQFAELCIARDIMRSPDETALSCTGAAGAAVADIDAYQGIFRIRVDLIRDWMSRILFVAVGSLHFGYLDSMPRFAIGKTYLN